MRPATIPITIPRIIRHAWNAGQRLTYWRDEPFEVDAVLEGTWGRWAPEVKVGPVAPADLRGLLEFSRRFPEYRPVLTGDASAHVEAMTWRDSLLGGPPGTPPTPCPAPP